MRNKTHVESALATTQSPRCPGRRKRFTSCERASHSEARSNSCNSVRVMSNNPCCPDHSSVYMTFCSSRKAPQSGAKVVTFIGDLDFISIYAEAVRRAVDRGFVSRHTDRHRRTPLRSTTSPISAASFPNGWECNAASTCSAALRSTAILVCLRWRVKGVQQFASAAHSRFNWQCRFQFNTTAAGCGAHEPPRLHHHGWHLL